MNSHNARRQKNRNACPDGRVNDAAIVCEVSDLSRSLSTVIKQMTQDDGEREKRGPNRPRDSRETRIWTDYKGIYPTLCPEGVEEVFTKVEYIHKGVVGCRRVLSHAQRLPLGRG